MLRGYLLAPLITSLLALLVMNTWMLVSTEISLNEILNISIMSLPIFFIGGYLAQTLTVLPIFILLKKISIAGPYVSILVGIVSALVFTLIPASIGPGHGLPNNYWASYIQLLKTFIPLGMVCSYFFWKLGVNEEDKK